MKNRGQILEYLEKCQKLTWKIVSFRFEKETTKFDRWNGQQKWIQNEVLDRLGGNWWPTAKIGGLRTTKIGIEGIDSIFQANTAEIGDLKTTKIGFTFRIADNWKKTG